MNANQIEVDRRHDALSQVTILGLGLLGGSVAKSLRRCSSPPRIVAWARNETTARRLASMDWIDQVTTSLPDACEAADVIVVASPVSQTAELAIQAAKASPSHALITDVGSTKATIVAEVDRASTAAWRFVGAHPIAGSEKSGAEHAIETLFDGKLTILTPTETTDPAFLGRARWFWESVGCRVIEMPANLHDTHLAAVSHVPHLAASLIAIRTPTSALPLVGNGWRDMTRLAAGDVEMWTAIVRENRSAILESLGGLSAELSKMTHLIQSGDDTSLALWLAEARDRKLRGD
jgi:prephenate dehydrogenase